MALPNPYQQYRTQQINTAPKDKLLLMLYDGGIRFCNQAKKALQEKKIEDAHNSITRVQAIIEELMNTLDFDYGISHNLNALYDYMLNRLVEANTKKDGVIIDEVMGLLKDLRQTFAQAAALARGVKLPEAGGVDVKE